MQLLEDIFPAKVARILREGKKVEPERFEAVTIFFSDIVGFTTISASLRPEKVANLLERLYTKFDNLVREIGVFKLETIGDAFVCVGGLPDPQEDHTARIARFAIAAVKVAHETPVDEENLDAGTVQIRVGFHTGSIVAAVVGHANPRYTLFGDTSKFLSFRIV